MSPCSSSPPSVLTSGAVGNKVVWTGPGVGGCPPQDRVALRWRGSRGRPPRPRRPQQPGGTPTRATMVRSLKFRVITAISTGRTLAATPRDGRSVSNLNRPGRRGPPRHHSGGTRATTTGTAVVRPPGGTGEAGSLSVLLGAPLVPLSPHRPCPLQPGSTRPRLPGGRPTTLRPASPLGTPICPIINTVFAPRT
ncbi:hypothetical protein NDU88_000571 [Pleurodeles waltl]|uniref:Uncharacterized protein n=1 Tax=Pleurodeles waltl TaxID=8319 RepID=A0AAV7S908_PLEWA|nr:hypothetical protein NDU88_000571 [Pleurodeles waltl]